MIVYHPFGNNNCMHTTHSWIVIACIPSTHEVKGDTNKPVLLHIKHAYDL